MLFKVFCSSLRYSIYKVHLRHPLADSLAMISLNFAFVKLFFTKNEKILGAPFEAPKYRVFSLSDIIDQAVVAVVSAVYNSKGFSVIYVTECKEIML